MRVPGLWRVLSVVALAAVSVFGVTSPALAWAPWVNGVPPELDAGTTGYFVWHTGDGWQLRTHDDRSGSTYHGRLHTDGTFVDVNLVRAESTEQLDIEDGGHTIVFKFKTFNHVDGLDFKIDGGTRVRIHLQVDGHDAPLRDIYIGHDGRHPGSNPLVLFR